MKPIIDNFSAHATDYATFRPESPKEIFDFLYSHTPAFDVAWDCGTGNGQVAAKLADRFGKVYGSDISSEQLANAAKKDNIIYLNERAEQTTIPAGSVSLITAAQALHWFDFEKYYDEVRRVAAPGALIAVWTYVWSRITPGVDMVVDKLLKIIDKHWDAERKYVNGEYKNIDFPFREIKTPELHIIKQLSLNQFVGYLNTWSGIKNYIKMEGSNPLDAVIEELQAAWGATDERAVTWPVFLRAGFV
ncbi:MAG: class I SAM-dependent methyltransferase [Bacteroidota bacterium]